MFAKAHIMMLCVIYKADDFLSYFNNFGVT